MSDKIENAPSVTTAILRTLGFDVKPWTMELESGPTPMLQVTNAEGVTFYVREDCTASEALNRYTEKLKEFQVKH